MSTGRVPGLDGIRAIAIGLVLYGHTVIYGQFPSQESSGHAAAYAGVAVFFVLSGYLITNLLLIEEERTGGISLKLFYMRRALRLFPALWLYLAVLAAIKLAGRLPDHPWHSFISSLFYFRNLVGRGHETDHLWSLSIEEQFYLVWPALLIVLPRKHRIRLVIAAAVIAGVTLWRIVASRYQLASIGAINIRSDFRFDAPLYGCAIALLTRIAPGSLAWTNRTPGRAGTMALAGSLGLLAWVVWAINERVVAGTDATAVSLFGVMLLLSQIGASGALTRWLTWAPLVFLGQISYGVYLWQQLFHGPSRPGFETIRAFPVGLIASFAVALLSYRWLEQPLLRLKDRRYHKQGV